MKFYLKDKFDKLPDVVIFDMDNTLYPYDPAHKFAQDAVRDKVVKSFSVQPKDFDKVFVEARNQIKELLGNTASSHNRLLYFQRMIELMGLGTQIVPALDLEQTYWRTFLNHAVLFDGVREFLDDLRLLRIPKGIVTDLTAQIQFRKIIYFGLDHAFDYVVTSEEAGCDKPESTAFDLILDKLSPRGDRIWMIGDHAEKDIGGIKNVTQAITLQKLHKGVSLGDKNNLPDASFEDYYDLIKLLKRLKQ